MKQGVSRRGRNDKDLAKLAKSIQNNFDSCEVASGLQPGDMSGLVVHMFTSMGYEGAAIFMVL